MNRMLESSLTHALFALGLQIIVGIITQNWWAGGLAASAGFFMREHAQRQYKIAKGMSIKELHPLVGADVLNWSLDAKLDFLVPTFVVAALYAAVAFIV